VIHRGLFSCGKPELSCRRGLTPLACRADTTQLPNANRLQLNKCPYCLADRDSRPLVETEYSPALDAPKLALDSEMQVVEQAAVTCQMRFVATGAFRESPVVLPVLFRRAQPCHRDCNDPPCFVAQ